ncbi:MAG TPA: hypothetical protein VOA87_19440 [Thermoanaerobaculia bacterium]|nr:hypothetical protein [Thermoanaerobaculia bacterium]
MSRIDVRRMTAVFALALGLLAAGAPSVGAGQLELTSWLAGLWAGTGAGIHSPSLGSAVAPRAGAAGSQGLQTRWMNGQGGCIDPNGCPHVLSSPPAPPRSGAGAHGSGA